MKFNIEEAIALLQRTPKVLNDLLGGIAIEWIQNNEGKDTWNPYDIVGHLIHGEQTDWIPRTQIILNETNKSFKPFDRFAQFENSKGKTLEQLLIEFMELRRENIEKLRSFNINAEKLEQTGIHPDLGIVTLKQLLATWVIHDLSHINQITRVMMKNYTSEVGPWSKYISILRDNN